VGERGGEELAPAPAPRVHSLLVEGTDRALVRTGLCRHPIVPFTTPSISLNRDIYAEGGAVSSRGPRGRMSRRALLDALTEAGRAHSDATVLFHAAVADELGLNPTDHKVMSILERRGPLSAGQIPQRTGLATASVTALLDRLETRGVVRRRSDPAARRR